MPLDRICLKALFLSTPSARRATLWPVSLGWQHLKISIHALREEGDEKHKMKTFAVTKFLSTPSARRATCYQVGRSEHPYISIHALREEGDVIICCLSLGRK